MEIAPLIQLFHPEVPEEAISAVVEVLRSRWIGQGPQVDAFETEFSSRFPGGSAVAVGSGTDALHLAYLLAGIGPGDEVITPVFTCTATNIPLLYLGAIPRFADIETNTLCVDVSSVERLITPRTKAIVCTHYGGLSCDMEALGRLAQSAGVPLIADAAQALGATNSGLPITAHADYSVFSFQAIKHITTGDGGMLVVRDGPAAEELVARAKRLRWFGIERDLKQKGLWDNEIREVGFKYQMTDIAAAMGRAALHLFEKSLAHRISLMRRYDERLGCVAGLRIASDSRRHDGHSAWSYTVFAERRAILIRRLASNNIEADPTHYRNDRYQIFSPYQREDETPNMDFWEPNYLMLPLHAKLTLDDVDRVCDEIQAGW
jgi:perosamine synthetase